MVLQVQERKSENTGNPIWVTSWERNRKAKCVSCLSPDFLSSSLFRRSRVIRHASSDVNELATRIDEKKQHRNQKKKLYYANGQLSFRNR